MASKEKGVTPNDTERVCPTCGSDDSAKDRHADWRGVGYQDQVHRDYVGPKLRCPDPFHDADLGGGTPDAGTKAEGHKPCEQSPSAGPAPAADVSAEEFFRDDDPVFHQPLAADLSAEPEQQGQVEGWTICGYENESTGARKGLVLSGRELRHDERVEVVPRTALAEAQDHAADGWYTAECLWAQLEVVQALLQAGRLRQMERENAAMERSGPDAFPAMLSAMMDVRDGRWVKGAPSHVLAEYLTALEDRGWRLVREGHGPHGVLGRRNTG